MSGGIPEIAVDARFLATGLGTYTLNVLRNLDAGGKIRIRCITGTKDINAVSSYCDEVREVNAAMYSVSEQIQVAAAARGADLFHATHYNVPLAYPGKMLVTIHDLTHILDKTFRRTIKSLLYAQPMLRIAVRRATHVVTVSEYSKRNLMELLGAQPEKITVIPNGVDGSFYPGDRLKALQNINQLCQFEGPYILYLGNLKPHKNVEGLLRAFSILAKKPDCDYKLLIVGDDGTGRAELMRVANELRLGEQVVFVRRMEQGRLRELYCGATVTVLPSFEEGFGLPVLESMACGTPVACSGSASLPEVGGDAVEYFDPSSPESIACTLEKLLMSDELRAEIGCRGLERAKKFSWRTSAAAHLALYKSLTA